MAFVVSKQKTRQMGFSLSVCRKKLKKLRIICNKSTFMAYRLMVACSTNGFEGEIRRSGSC